MRPALCVSYKEEILRGVHSDSDRYMLALYTGADAISEFTKAYVSRGEAVGTGYRAGGKQLQNMRVEQDGSSVVLTFDDITWSDATLKNVCCGLIYNASKQNKAVGVLVLMQTSSSTNGPFTIYFPEANASEGVFVLD